VSQEQVLVINPKRDFQSKDEPQTSRGYHQCGDFCWFVDGVSTSL